MIVEAGGAVTTTFTTYNATDSAAASVSGISYGASCAGVGASFDSHVMKRSLDTQHNPRTDIPPAPGCDYTTKAKHTINFKDIPTNPSQLKLKMKAKNFCLSPYRIQVTGSKDGSHSARSLLHAQDCTGLVQQKAIYDTLGRVVFSNDEAGLPVCMTAPEHVVRCEPWSAKHGVSRPR